MSENKVLDTISLNLYQKLQKIRVELQQADLKKSGENKFSNFKYYQLNDFLPKLNELMDKYHIFTYTEINEEIGTIYAIDTDKTENIPFTLTIPTSKVEVKGASEIQKAGALITYARRYLYMSLFEIVEADTLDAIIGKDDKKKPPKSDNGEKSTLAKVKELVVELGENGKRDDVTKVLQEIANVKNPSNIKDEAIMLKVIAELEKIK